MEPRDLLSHARTLLRSSRGAPRQVNLRRAISAAYYALFHAFLRAAADELIGRTATNRRSRAYAMVYRAFEHAKMQRDCRDAAKPALPAEIADATGLHVFSPDIRRAARAFVVLQEARHNADYNPHFRFSKTDVQTAMTEAELGIESLERAAYEMRRIFLLSLLFRRRRTLNTLDTPCRLYLITPPEIESRTFAETLKRALDAGDVASLQLRLKNVSDDEIRHAAEVLMPIAQARDAAFILNDRPDLAAELGCDGVHIGQEDCAYSQARAALGPDKIVGVTCHVSRHLAIEAAEAGADYVAFGAFYPTATKETKTHAEPGLIEWWSELMVVPCVAIGGITVENAKPLIEAGADFLAVSSGVWDHKDGPGAAVMAFNALFKK